MKEEITDVHLHIEEITDPLLTNIKICFAHTDNIFQVHLSQTEQFVEIEKLVLLCLTLNICLLMSHY